MINTDNNQNHAKDFCPICHSLNIVPEFRSADFAVSKNIYSVLKCHDCGFLMTDVVYDGKSMSNLEKVDLKLRQGYSPKKFLDFCYYVTRRFMLYRKAWYVHWLTGLYNGTLINYGAKTGFFSSTMEKKGWNVLSYESIAAERDFSKKMLDHRMFPPEELDTLPIGCADVVTMWHSFEHMDNPKLILLKLCRVLSRNGLIFMAMPNADSYDAEYYKQYWAAWDVPRHLWHFTPKTCQQLASTVGLSLMYKKAMPFDVFYISILSERNKKSHLAFIKGLFKGFGFFLMSIKDKNKASSVLYVFKKTKR